MALRLGDDCACASARLVGDEHLGRAMTQLVEDAEAAQRDVLADDERDDRGDRDDEDARRRASRAIRWPRRDRGSAGRRRGRGRARRGCRPAPNAMRPRRLRRRVGATSGRASASSKVAIDLGAGSRPASGAKARGARTVGLGVAGRADRAWRRGASFEPVSDEEIERAVEADVRQDEIARRRCARAFRAA